MKNTSTTPTHIFVVENSGTYVKMLDYIFSKDFSFRFVNFKSGEDCLENLHLLPDIIILDYSLPGLSGYDTLVEIKKKDPNVYVLVLLSDKDDKLPSDLFNAGADDYILKENLQGGDITDKVEAFLNRELLSRSLQGKSGSASLKQVCYYLLALLAVSAGVYYYQ